MGVNLAFTTRVGALLYACSFAVCVHSAHGARSTPPFRRAFALPAGRAPSPRRRLCATWTTSHSATRWTSVPTNRPTARAVTRARCSAAGGSTAILQARVRGSSKASTARGSATPHQRSRAWRRRTRLGSSAQRVVLAIVDFQKKYTRDLPRSNTSTLSKCAKPQAV